MPQFISRVALLFFAGVAVSGAVLPCLAAATPSTVNYQGLLTDNTPAQNPITGTVNLQFAIFDSESGGALLWSEPIMGPAPTAVTDGIFQVVLGSHGNPLDPTVFSGGTSRWLEIRVNGETLVPRQRLSSVAYAHRAENADTSIQAQVANNASQLDGFSPTSWQRTLFPSACPAGQFFSDISQSGSASCNPPPPDGHWIASGADLESGVSGNVGIGTAPSSKLDVAGVITADGVRKVGSGAPTSYNITTQRYVVDAPPSSVGVVVPLDTAVVDALCRDLDGCLVTLAMLNWDPTRAGQAANREDRFFISETTRWWRIQDPAGSDGLDNGNGVQEWAHLDCFFGDAETYTGAANGRTDSAIGMGLLNLAGGSYSDATTICRVVLSD